MPWPPATCGRWCSRWSRPASTRRPLHNVTGKPKVVRLDAKNTGNALLVDLLDTHDSRADANGRHTIELPPYGYRWLRAGGIDLTEGRVGSRTSGARP